MWKTIRGLSLAALATVGLTFGTAPDAQAQTGRLTVELNKFEPGDTGGCR